jgi:Rieske 2Fe-2S family protein
MTHRLEPLAPGRTAVECQWLFSPDDLARPGFDPSDAIGLWDVTNRQDWAAVESVQRGIASPRYRPGVLAHNEDSVYQFVAMVAAGYLGRPLVRGAIGSDYRR